MKADGKKENAYDAAKRVWPTVKLRVLEIGFKRFREEVVLAQTQ